MDDSSLVSRPSDLRGGVEALYEGGQVGYVGDFVGAVRAGPAGVSVA